MILDKVIIQNYRQYKDVTIEFAKDIDKNFTIIKGNNGTGKTTLLNALSWCLYGEEIHDYGDDATMSICNNKAVKLTETGKGIKVIVKIEFLDDGKLLAFERTRYFRKGYDGLQRTADEDKFEVIQQDKHDIERYTNDYYMLERKIPKEIEDYFFFDGARLGEYFQKNTHKKIKDSVFNLSQLNLVDNVRENLNKVEKKYTDKQNKVRPKLGKINGKIIEKNLEKEELENNLKNNKVKLSEIDDEIKNIREELLNKNSKDVETKVKRDKDLEFKIKKIRDKLDGLNIERENLILTNYPYILAYNYFNNFLNVGEDSRENGFIPADFKTSFLKDLLASGNCICGADLASDNEHRKKILDLLKNTPAITDKSEEITTALTQVKESILKNIKQFKNKSQDLNGQIDLLEEEEEKDREERKKINSFLDNISPEDISKLNQQKKMCEHERDKCINEIGRDESRIEKVTSDLNNLREKRNEEDKLEQINDELNKKIIFCENACNSAEKIYNELASQMKNRIQNLTKQKFIKIQWKKDEFNDIHINDDYEVFIKNKLGDEERPGDLSDGEKLCLGLCFMSALHTISGFDLPIIMDTPLGNLDVDMRHNIAKFLPSFVDGKQTILLVTGTEYTDDFRDTIYPNIGKEYVINWSNSDDGKESKVVELNGGR